MTQFLKELKEKEKQYFLEMKLIQKDIEYRNKLKSKKILDNRMKNQTKKLNSDKASLPFHHAINSDLYVYNDSVNWKK